jgi:hypothetical protein
VDRDFTTTPVNAQTKFIAERWTEIDTVNATENASAIQKDFDLSDIVGKKIQFKIELRDAETSGYEVSLTSMTFGYIQKKPV